MTPATFLIRPRLGTISGCVPAPARMHSLANLRSRGIHVRYSIQSKTIDGPACGRLSRRDARSRLVAPRTFHLDRSVLAPLLPDPAPPGVLDYLMPGLEIWEARHQVRIKYETSAVENMRAKILNNFRHGYHCTMSCTALAGPRSIAGHLLSIDSLVSPGVRGDLPAWSLNSFRWRGRLFGLPSAANPMILFGTRNECRRPALAICPERGMNWHRPRPN